MTKKVLIVDDNQNFLRSIKKMLEIDGKYSVLIAQDGLIAIERLKGNTISLVVTDLKMPRLDGFGLLAYIIGHYPDVAVIIMTAYSTPPMKSLVQDIRISGFMEKPFPLDYLVQNVSSILEKESDGGELHSISPSMFLQLLQIEEKTCTIRMTDKKSGKIGVLFFRQGELLDARAGRLRGKAAAYRVLAWDEVSLSIQNFCPQNEDRIKRDLQVLTLEAMSMKDEAGIVDEPSIATHEKEGIENLFEKGEQQKPEFSALRNELKKEISRRELKEEPYASDSTKKQNVSYTFRDAFSRTLSPLPSLLHSTAVALRISLKISSLFVLVCLAIFFYLFANMETEKDLAKKIDQSEAIVILKEAAISQTNREIKQIQIRMDVINKSEETDSGKIDYMNLKLKALDLKVRKADTLVELETHQKALMENLEKLKEIRQKTFLQRLLKK